MAGGGELDWQAARRPSIFLSTNGTVATNLPCLSTVTVGLNSAASNLPPGSYTATVWLHEFERRFQCRPGQFMLDIITAPVITAQPANVSVPVAALKQPSRWGRLPMPCCTQWQANGTNLTDGGTSLVRRPAT